MILRVIKKHYYYQLMGKYTTVVIVKTLSTIEVKKLVQKELACEG